jgi:pSer/pThr/pTyr-binding forkhead associated (FHA) protein
MADPVTATAAVVAVGGGTMSAIEKRKAAKAQADFQRQQAEATRNQVQELLRRGGIQLDNIERQGRDLVANQAAGFVKGGIDVSSGGALATMENAQRLIARQYIETQNEINFSTSQALLGAQSLEEAASRIDKAADRQFAGDILSLGGNLFLAAGGPKGTKETE